MSRPPVTDLEKRTRVLTMAIHLLQPQYAAAETSTPAKRSSHHALSKACNHLAILLAQGSEKEAGAGRRRVVAVTGNFTSSGLSVCVVEETDDQNPDMESLKAKAIEVLKSSVSCKTRTRVQVIGTL